MTDTESPLDLSILAQVDSTDRPDERPDTARAAAAPTGRASDEPPRRARGRTRTESAEKPTGPRSFVRDEETLFEYKPGILVKPIRDFYMTIAMVAMPFSEPIATSVAQNAEECAKAWDNAAKVDKRIRKYLVSAMQGTAWAPVAITHLPILTVVAAEVVRKRPQEPVTPVESGQVANPVSNGYQRR